MSRSAPSDSRSDRLLDEFLATMAHDAPRPEARGAAFVAMGLGSASVASGVAGASVGAGAAGASVGAGAAGASVGAGAAGASLGVVTAGASIGAILVKAAAVGALAGVVAASVVTLRRPDVGSGARRGASAQFSVTGVTQPAPPVAERFMPSLAPSQEPTAPTVAASTDGKRGVASTATSSPPAAAVPFGALPQREIGGADPLPLPTVQLPAWAEAVDDAMGTTLNAQPVRDAGLVPWSPARASLRDETAVLERARTAMARGDAASGLTEVDAYDTRFPSGILRPEALLLRIEGLVRLGKSQQAREVARTFATRHPQSPHLARVRTLVGQ